MSDRQQRIVEMVRVEAAITLKEQLMVGASDRISETDIDILVGRVRIALGQRLLNSIELCKACEDMELILPNGKVNTGKLISTLGILQQQNSGTAYGHKIQYLKAHAETVLNKR
jgi:hypothetical protein